MSRNLKGPKDTVQHFTRRKLFADRVQRRMDALGLSQSDVARKLGVDQSSVNRWLTPLRGYSLPEGLAMIDLPPVLECSYRWLLTGEGPMTPEDTSDLDAFRQGARTAYAEVGALVQGRLEGLKLGTQVNGVPTSQAEADAESYRQRMLAARQAAQAAQTTPPRSARKGRPPRAG